MTDQPKTDGLLRPYAIITDKICAMLSQGVIPWRKPWNVENADPVSLASGKQYRGVNIFMLETSAAMSGYRSRYWVTFKQALERGGNVRKGEQATPVVFWKILEKHGDRKGSDGDEHDGAEPNGRKIPILKHYNLFNVEQCEGIEYPTPKPATERPFDPIAACEQIVQAMPRPPTIAHRGNRACYMPLRDEVHMPPRDQFIGAEEYYSTLFHELVLVQREGFAGNRRPAGRTRQGFAITSPSRQIAPYAMRRDAAATSVPARDVAGDGAQRCTSAICFVPTQFSPPGAGPRLDEWESVGGARQPPKIYSPWRRLMSTLFQPFSDFDLLRRELDRTLESFRIPGVVRNAFLPARNPRSFPLVNIAEDADGYRVEALAPGVNPDSLQINVLRDQLTISGEKPALAEDGIRSENYHRSERAAGRFTRTFTLPAAIDENKVSAEYKAGILKIALPKSESAKPRRIAVTMS